MAIPKRRRHADQDSPAAKKIKTNTLLSTSFTLSDFMGDFLVNGGPIESDKDSPLPSTFLSQNEMQHSSQNKPTLRSTFNIMLPKTLGDQDDESAENVPYEWMKNQYAHCIIPELGEEYDFEFESSTFHTLRDLHNARVRIRNGEYLPDYIIDSLATRWISLEEKDRPASDGYFADGDIFVATCLPICDLDDGLEEYFERHYSSELSAPHYIPRSRYSVHFVGDPMRNEIREIQNVHVGSVLIRRSKTGDVIHIDTGAEGSRIDRAKKAGQVLKSWLEFQKRKSPEANLGPVSSSEPLLLNVDKETHPSLRSLHAIVSASLFLRRGITNWGEVKAFKQRFKPSSTTMANYALQNISGWLGLKSASKNGEKRSTKPTKSSNTFQDNYDRGALLGRDTPFPVSPRIASAKRGEPFVYNEESELGDSSSESSAENNVDESHNRLDNTQATVVSDQQNNNEEMSDEEPSDEHSSSELSNDKESHHELAKNEEPADKESANKDIIKETPTKKSAIKETASKESSTKKSVSWEEPEHEEVISKVPNTEETTSKEPNNEETNGDDPTHEDGNSEKSGHDVDCQTSSSSV